MTTTTNRTASSRESKPRPELEAEEAFRRQKAATDEVIETGRRIAEDAATITRRSTETLQHTVQSGIEIATRVAERSIDQLSSAAGLPSKQTEEAAQKSSLNLRAIFDSSAAMAGAVQQLQEEMLERATTRMQQNLELFETILRCRDVNELAAIQIDYARDQLESLISSSRRASELVGEAADTALKRIRAVQPARAA